MSVELLTVREAAKILNITVGRVHQLISENRLPAEKLGSQYVVKKSDLELVNDRKPGRPKKLEIEGQAEIVPAGSKSN